MATIFYFLFLQYLFDYGMAQSLNDRLLLLLGKGINISP